MHRRRIQTYVPDQTFLAFQRLATTHSTTVSALARRILCAAGSSQAAAAGPREFEVAGPAMPAGSGKQIGVRVPVELFTVLGDVAAEHGQTRAGWVASLLHTMLRDGPMLRREEMAQLRESTRQLWAIGVTLNQIARAMNVQLKVQGRADDADVRAELIRECIAAIDRQAAAVARVLSGTKATYRSKALMPSKAKVTT